MAYRVFLSPSDQKKNAYAYGNTNEAEVCGKIAEATKAALIRCGIEVDMTQYEPMSSKCAKSDAFGANLHVPIHTNAYNHQVAGTRIMCSSMNGEGYRAAKAIFDVLAPITPGTSENVSAHPELYEIRVASAPTAYIEVDFHDVPAVAKWLIANTKVIGEAICHGICNYFGDAYIPVEGISNGTEAMLAQFEALLLAHEKQLADNDAGVWSAEARTWALDNGIINGIGQLEDGTPNYAWEAHVTREQLVTILHRFAGLTQQ